MIEAYVLGRPMPRSSSALVSAASLYRLGRLRRVLLGGHLDALRALRRLSTLGSTVS